MFESRQIGLGLGRAFRLFVGLAAKLQAACEREVIGKGFPVLRSHRRTQGLCCYFFSMNEVLYLIF
jgi:hypothetical protein